MWLVHALNLFYRTPPPGNIVITCRKLSHEFVAEDAAEEELEETPRSRRHSPDSAQPELSSSSNEKVRRSSLVSRDSLASS